MCQISLSTWLVRSWLITVLDGRFDQIPNPIQLDQLCMMSIQFHSYWFHPDLAEIPGALGSVEIPEPTFGFPSTDQIESSV